jgi:trk system potassium uptake protein
LFLAIEPLKLIDILFVTSSAFGTVGLSSLNIADLHTMNKILLILIMFLGRIGPLSFGIALTLKTGKKDDVVYPEEKILVG